MSFPTTPILDNFNRPDCGPPPSANWLSDATKPGLIVDTMQCAGVNAAGESINYWSSAITRPDCEVYVTISTADPVGAAGLGWRFKTLDFNNPNNSYYILVIDHVTNEIGVGARTAGVTHPVTTFFQAVNNGDSVGVRMIGNTATIYYRPAGGAWDALGTFVDDDVAAGGYLALIAMRLVERLDDFGGGNYSVLASCNHYCELSDVEGLLKRDFSETDPDLTEALIESYICMRAGEIDAARQAGAQMGALSAGGAQYLKYLNMIGAASLVDLSCRGGMSNAAEFPTRAWWVEEFRQGLEKIRLSQIIVTQSGTGADYPACGTAERGWTPFADLRIMRNRGR